MGESYRELLDFAVETAYLAGRSTLGYFRTGVRPDMKKDNSPVTVADKLSEQVIRARVKEYYPHHAVLGEEYGLEGGEHATHRWLVDPIDGTKQFVRGLPYYSVLIGLEIEGNVEVGAAYFPAVDEMFFAAIGEGCWWNGRPCRVSAVEQLKQGYLLFEAMHLELLRPAWDYIKQHTYHQMGWGDAYSFMLIASGRAELMLDDGLEVWDCAPLSPILKEAGGYFGDWDGTPFSHGRRVLATTQKLLPQALELTRIVRERAAALKAG